MDGTYRYKLRISGIVAELVLPEPIIPPADMAAFLCDADIPADDTYTLTLITEPLHPAEPMLCKYGEAHIYHTKDGWLHLFPALGDREGCQVACLFCPDGHHRLFYPAARWPFYAKQWVFATMLQGERLLLRHGAFLLHSSVVELHGKTVLFSAPSGMGKSTQATLWEQHLGATVLNGDRAVIRRTDTGFTAAGSFWSGTSGIYVPRQAPIAGIFLLEQAPENSVEPVGIDGFKALLSETTVNTWDPDFMAQITDLLCDVMTMVPIYRLRCRPDKGAAELAYQTLFGKERSACKS